MSVNSGKGMQLPWGVTHTLTKKIDIADDDLVVSMGWLPANSAVIGSGVSVATAFSASSAEVLDLGFRSSVEGHTDDPDAFTETALAVDALGHLAGDVVSTANLYFSEPAEVTASLTATGTLTAGEGYAYVTYVCFGNQEEL